MAHGHVKSTPAQARKHALRPAPAGVALAPATPKDRAAADTERCFLPLFMLFGMGAGGWAARRRGYGQYGAGYGAGYGPFGGFGGFSGGMGGYGGGYGAGYGGAPGYGAGMGGYGGGYGGRMGGWPFFF